MNTLRNISIALLSLILLPAAVWAQSSSYVLADNSSMVITGTSTIHDWEADVESMDLEINFDPSLLGTEQDSSAIQGLTFTAKAESIESGKGRMDNKIYDALKVDDHPTITFTMSEAEVANYDEATGNLSLNVTGALTIAGVEKTVTFPVQGERMNNGSYSFEGNYSLNMEDYDIDPPSAVFGTIKSGEEVDINFSMVLTASNS